MKERNCKRLKRYVFKLVAASRFSVQNCLLSFLTRREVSCVLTAGWPEQLMHGCIALKEWRAPACACRKVTGTKPVNFCVNRRDLSCSLFMDGRRCAEEHKPVAWVHKSCSKSRKGFPHFKQKVCDIHRGERVAMQTLRSLPTCLWCLKVGVLS